MFEKCEDCKKCGENTCECDPSCGCYESREKPFSVLITETTIRTRMVSVLAEDRESAADKIRGYYDAGAYDYNNDLWDISNAGGVEFEANEIPTKRKVE